jgi:hypothetical protein
LFGFPKSSSYHHQNSAILSSGHPGRRQNSTLSVNYLTYSCNITVKATHIVLFFLKISVQAREDRILLPNECAKFSGKIKKGGNYNRNGNKNENIKMSMINNNVKICYNIKKLQK